jgi:hypothetical protein
LIKRRLLWLGVGLVALPLAAVLLPWGWYAVPGLLRGEHFYEGLPSSYWRRQLTGSGNEWRSSRLRGGECFRLVGQVLFYLDWRGKPILADTSALPVLAELLHDQNPLVRHAAIQELGEIPGEEADHFLEQALADPHPFVQQQARGLLDARKRATARKGVR